MSLLDDWKGHESKLAMQGLASMDCYTDWALPAAHNDLEFCWPRD